MLRTQNQHQYEHGIFLVPNSIHNTATIEKWPQNDADISGRYGCLWVSLKFNS